MAVASGVAETPVKWDMGELSKPPQVFESGFPQKDGVKSIFYAGVPYEGKATRVFAYLADDRSDLKVLMIGNSFSISVLREMPSVAASMGCRLDLASMYIGGCSLERHWNNLVASTNVDFKPYGYERNVRGKTLFRDVPANLLAVLKSDRWDVVTLQQASHFSWRPETFEPFLSNLIGEIKKLQPGAKICFQETWSYTPWDVRLAKWGITPDEMFAKIHAACGEHARAHGLEVIPTGTAIDLYRKALPVVYRENSFGGDPCGGRWGGEFVKDEPTGKWKPGKGLDVFHLGYDGEYLQALVWTAAMFGVDVTRCDYVPKYVATAERADKMRQCAQKAVDKAPESAGLPVLELSADAWRQTFVAQGTKETYEGHPTTLLSDDQRTMFCIWTPGHGGAVSRLARSDDGGRSWTRIDELLPADYVASNLNCPTLQKIKGPDGKTRYFAFSCKLKPETDEGGRKLTKAERLAGLGILMSEDDGRTWRELPSQPHLSAGMPPTGLMQLKDGTTALFGQVRCNRAVKTDGPNDDQEIWMSVSRDGGFTWGEARVVASKPGRNLCEPCCLRSPDGRSLALLMRDNRHTGPSAISFSHDEGKTWSEPRDTQPGLTGDRHEAIMLPDGRYFIAFRNRHIGDPLYGQFMAWVGTWNDLVRGGKGQCRVHLLKHHGKPGRWPGNEIDTGYSGVELLPDGTIVCTTYTIAADDGRQSSVVSMRLNVKELTAGSVAQKPALVLRFDDNRSPQQSVGVKSGSGEGRFH